jgi:hypothetical protein
MRQYGWDAKLTDLLPTLELAKFSSVVPKKRRLTLVRPCASVRASTMAYN